MPVPDAVVVSATRTAMGMAFKGTLLDVDALELGTQAVAQAVRRAGLDPALVVTRRDCSTITFAVDEHLGATPPWRSWRRSSRCTPRSRASASRPATRRGQGRRPRRARTLTFTVQRQH